MRNADPKVEQSTRSRLHRASRRFPHDARGGVALLFSLILPPLALGVVAAIELTEVAAMRVKLQNIVDGAALNGAREFAVDRSQATAMRTEAKATTEAEPAKLRWAIETKVQTAADTNTLTVTQTATRPSFFGNLLPPGGFRIEVSATAATSPTAPLCVLGLETAVSPTVSVAGSSALSALGCLVHSNNDVLVTGVSRIEAARVRTTKGSKGTVLPSAVTDSPLRQDPFATLAISPSPTCTDTNFSIQYGTATLGPGVHCGTVSLGGAATVVLAPGDHIFVGPKFAIGGAAKVSGVDVALIFKDQGSITVGEGAEVRLEGRRSGTYAGFVFVVDRSYSGSVSIAAQTVKKLFGTLYAPNATVAVSGASGALASESPWTVVIAKRMEISGASQVTINSNYVASSVPIPNGVGNNSESGSSRLVR